MTFEAKRTSIKTITEDLAKSKGFKKTKSNSFPQNKLLDEIRQLNDYRNYFAHYTDVAMSDKNGLLDYVIALHERRDSKQKRMYNLSQFNGLIDRIKNANDEIDELTRQFTNVVNG
jgi:hypothetical protein